MVVDGQLIADTSEGSARASDPFLPADDADISPAWLGRYEWLAVREASRFYSRFPGCRDDLLQECRIALLRASEMFDAERGTPFSAYAARIVSRAAQKFVLHECRRGFSGCAAARFDSPPTVIAAAPDSGGTKPPLELVADEYKRPTHWSDQRWSKIFQCLSESQQRVVRLRLFKDLTNREVGEILGFRESRASFLWQQALRRLRENRMVVDEY